jgi:hypothetical protein
MEEQMGESYNRQREGTPSIEPALRVAVTGGTAGLGLALVREFRRRGAAIAFVARTRARGVCGAAGPGQSNALHPESALSKIRADFGLEAINRSAHFCGTVKPR